MAAWVRRKDIHHHRFEVVPYQEAPSPPMTLELREACARAAHVVQADGTVIKAGRASLFVLENLGWGWAARLLSIPPFIWLVEFGYWIVAATRSILSRYIFTKERSDE